MARHRNRPSRRADIGRGSSERTTFPMRSLKTAAKTKIATFIIHRPAAHMNAGHNLLLTNAALYKPSSSGKHMQIQKSAVVLALLMSTVLAFADGKPKLTLDEFFNSVSFSGLEISPDGS